MINDNADVRILQRRGFAVDIDNSNAKAKEGEIIVYLPDKQHPTPRIKIGDSSNRPIKDLPFVQTEILEELGYNNESTLSQSFITQLYNRIVRNQTQIHHWQGGFLAGEKASVNEHASDDTQFTGGAIGQQAQSISGGAVGKLSSTTSGAAIGYQAQSTHGGAVGEDSYSTLGFAGGSQSKATSGGAAGLNSATREGGAIGENAYSTNGFAGGQNAIASANNSVQLGAGENRTQGTLQFKDYPLVDEYGNIPAERLKFAGEVHPEGILKKADYAENDPSSGSYIANRPLYETTVGVKDTVNYSSIDFQTPTDDCGYGLFVGEGNLDLQENNIYQVSFKYKDGTSSQVIETTCKKKEYGYKETILSCIFRDSNKCLCELIQAGEDKLSHALYDINGQNFYTVRIYLQNWNNFENITITNLSLVEKDIQKLNSKFLTQSDNIEYSAEKPISGSGVGYVADKKINQILNIKNKQAFKTLEVQDCKPGPITTLAIHGDTTQHHFRSHNLLDLTSLDMPANVDIQGFSICLDEDECLNVTGLFHTEPVEIFSQEINFNQIRLINKTYDGIMYLTLTGETEAGIQEIVNTKDQYQDVADLQTYTNVKVHLWIKGSLTQDDKLTHYINGFKITDDLNLFNTFYSPYHETPWIYNGSPIENTKITSLQNKTNYNILNPSIFLNLKNIDCGIEPAAKSVIFNNLKVSELKEELLTLPYDIYTFRQSGDNKDLVLGYSFRDKLHPEIETSIIDTTVNGIFTTVRVEEYYSEQIEVVLYLINKNNSIHNYISNFWGYQGVGKKPYMIYDENSIATEISFEPPISLGVGEKIYKNGNMWVEKTCQHTEILSGDVALEKLSFYKNNNNTAVYTYDISEHKIHLGYPIISNRFIYQLGSKDNAVGGYFETNETGDKIFLVFHEQMPKENTAAFKNWLKSHNIIFHYVEQLVPYEHALKSQLQNELNNISLNKYNQLHTQGRIKLDYIEKEVIYNDHNENILSQYIVSNFNKSYEKYIFGAKHQNLRLQKNQKVSGYVLMQDNSKIAFDTQVAEEVKKSIDLWKVSINDYTFYETKEVIQEGSIHQSDIEGKYIVATNVPNCKAIVFTNFVNANSILPEYENILQSDCLIQDPTAHDFIKNKPIYDYGWSSDYYSIMINSNNQPSIELDQSVVKTFSFEDNAIIEGSFGDVPFELKCIKDNNKFIFTDTTNYDIDRYIERAPIRIISADNKTILEILYPTMWTKTNKFRYRIKKANNYKQLDNNLLKPSADFLVEDTQKCGYIKNNPYLILDSENFSTPLATGHFSDLNSETGALATDITLPLRGRDYNSYSISFNFEPQEYYKLTVTTSKTHEYIAKAFFNQAGKIIFGNFSLISQNSQDTGELFALAPNAKNKYTLYVPKDSQLYFSPETSWSLTHEVAAKKYPFVSIAKEYSAEIPSYSTQVLNANIMETRFTFPCGFYAGEKAVSKNYGVAIGQNANANNAISLGNNSNASQKGIAMGENAKANFKNAIVIANNGTAKRDHDIILGDNSSTKTSGQLDVFGNTLLKADGKIPEARMVFSETIQPAGAGVEETNLVQKSVVKRYIDDISDNITIIKNSQGGFAAGTEAAATTGVAIGKNAISSADNAIQLGTGTNNNANSLQVFGQALLNDSHKIPELNYDFATTIDDSKRELVKRSVIKDYVDDETANRIKSDNDIINNVSIISNASGGFSAGASSSATTGVAIGKGAKSTASDAIQLGAGTNSTASTFQVMDATVLDANHYITENNYNFMTQMADDGTKRELVKRSVVKKYIDDETTSRTTADDNIINNTSIISNSKGGFAAGKDSVATGQNAIQLGSGTNSTDNTFQVFDITLLNAEHKIVESNYDFATGLADGTKELISRTIVKSEIENEAAQRDSADTTLTTNLNKEINDRTKSEAAINQAISTETTERQSQDSSLQESISAEATTREQQDNALSEKITAEEQARTTLDTTLTQRIATEEAARAALDTALTQRIAAEEETRAKTDSALSNEVSARQQLGDTVSSNKTQTDEAISTNATAIAALEKLLKVHKVNIAPSSSNKKFGVGVLDLQACSKDNLAVAGVDTLRLEANIHMEEKDITMLENWISCFIDTQEYLMTINKIKEILGLSQEDKVKIDQSYDPVSSTCHTVIDISHKPISVNDLKSVRQRMIDLCKEWTEKTLTDTTLIPKEIKEPLKYESSQVQFTNNLKVNVKYITLPII